MKRDIENLENHICVSVITITYNSERNIEKTVKSVLRQKYNNVEYIIIDGNSIDNTLGILDEYKSQITKIISEPDRGISDAFNKGIRNSTGELIMFLNSGDYFVDDDVISRVVIDYSDSPQDVVFYNVRLGNRNLVSNNSRDGELLWENGKIPHQGAFVRKSVFERIGLFDEKYKLRMDLDFWCRCIQSGLSHKYYPRVIVDYEIGGASMQAVNAKRFYEEGLEIKKKYGIRVSAEERVLPLIPNWIRKLKRYEK